MANELKKVMAPKRAYTGLYSAQGNPVTVRTNYQTPWIQDDLSKKPESDAVFYTQSKLTGEIPAEVKARKVDGGLKPIEASMRFTYADLQQYATEVDTPSGKEYIGIGKSERPKDWASNATQSYLDPNDKSRDWDRGHLLGNYVTGVFGFEEWNQVPMVRELNADGAIWKAEELARMFAKNNRQSEITYKIVPDYTNVYKIKKKINDEWKDTDAPANLLVQLVGPNGANTFYIPNTKEAMQEPTRYMVNRRWLEKQKFVPENFINSMPDEEGYVNQFTTFFKNIAGDKAKTMSLKDAVRESYLESPAFRRQIKESEGE